MADDSRDEIADDGFANLPDPAGGAHRDGASPAESFVPADKAAGDPYALYLRGTDLLEQRLYAQAAISLESARKLEPGKTSILEALGRALFHSQRYREAADVFTEVTELRPDDDFAQFCLGRALEKTGDMAGARHHMALAVGLRPNRQDYRRYLDRARGEIT